CAVKAHRAVSSAAPAGRTNPSLVSLTAPVRALLTVAGDELRKDGGNEAGPGLRADPTGKPQKRAPNLGIRWGFNSKPFVRSNTMNAMTQTEVHTTHTAAVLEVADPTKNLIL